MAFWGADPIPQLTMLTAMRVESVDQSGWPTQGWARPTMLAPYWLGNEGRKPSANAAFVYGVTDDEVVLRLLRTAPRIPSEAVLGLRLHQEGGEKVRDIQWPLYGDPQAGRDMTLRHDIKDSGSGRVEYRIAISKESLGLDAGSHAPRLDLELIESGVDGRVIGRYRFGDAIVPGQSLKKKEPYRRISGQRLANYQLRQAIYEQAEAFIPQGDALVDWFSHRRALVGSDANIALADDMIKRTAKSACVVNAIAIAYLERLEKVRSAGSSVDETDPGFRATTDKLTAEVASIARSAGISDEMIDLGLARFEIDVHNPEPGQHDLPIPLVTLWAPDKRESALEVSTGYSSSAIGFPGHYYRITVMLGLMSGTPDEKIHAMQFDWADNTQYFINLALRRPSGDVPFIENGQLVNQAKYHVEKQEVVSLPDGRKALKVKADRRERQKLTFPAVTLPSTEKQRPITAADMLLALDNMPSDSNMAGKLIEGYLDHADRDQSLTEQDLIIRAFKRIGQSSSRVWALTERIDDHLREQHGDAWLSTLSELMREGDVARQVQRGVMSRYAGGVHDGAWKALGPFHPVDEPLTPLPEDVANPAQNGFVVADKMHQFVPLDKAGWRRDLKPALFYYAAEVTADSAGRSIIYLEWDHKWGANVMVWLNGELVMEERSLSSGMNRVTPIPARLQEGTNRILIRTVSHSSWVMRCQLGDTYGVPLPGVKWMK